MNHGLSDMNQQGLQEFDSARLTDKLFFRPGKIGHRDNFLSSLGQYRVPMLVTDFCTPC